MLIYYFYRDNLSSLIKSSDEDNVMNYNTDIDSLGEHDFAVWKDRATVADCLRKFGHNELANFTLKPSVEHEFIQDCINVLKWEATARKDKDIINRLAYAGLIG